MRKSVGSLAVVAAMVMGGLAGSPAVAMDSPAAVAEKKPAPAEKGHLAKKLNGPGWTELVSGPMYTKSGKRMKVKVRVRAGKGAAGRTQTVLDRRSGGRVYLWMSGTGTVRVRVTLTAAGKKREVRTYRYPRGIGGEVLSGGFTDFLGWVLKGVAEEIGEQAAGWAIGGLFGTGGDTKQLQQISAQLDQIQQSLKGIQSQLDAISRQSDFLACQLQSESMDTALSTILTAQQQYDLIMKTPETDPVTLKNWADSVVAGGTGGGQTVQWALNQIHLNLVDKGGNLGAISQCAKAKLADWTTPLAEKQYYNALYTYVQYYQYWQVRGLNLVLEATHLLAAQNAKAAGVLPANAKDVGSICDADKPKKGANETVKFRCNQALQLANTVYGNLMYQGAAQAGAGYVNNPAEGGDNYAIQKGTSLLWALDLSRSAGSERGKTGRLKNRKLVGYPGFAPATSKQWQTMFTAAGGAGKTLGERMDLAGFADNAAKRGIVYTGETTPGTAPEMMWPAGWYHGTATKLANNVAGMCLFDTRDTEGPYCQNTGINFRDLGNAFGSKPKKYWYTTADKAAQLSDPDFYTMRLDGSWYNDEQLMKPWYEAPALTTAPHWMIVNGDKSGVWDQPRWPVMDTASLPCSTVKIYNGESEGLQPVALRRTNGGGAVSMCGDDMVAWLSTWLPPAPPLWPPAG